MPKALYGWAANVDGQFVPCRNYQNYHVALLADHAYDDFGG